MRRSDRHRPPRRLALVTHVDLEDRAAWSGTPAGLRQGLEHWGVESVAVATKVRGLGRLTGRLGLGPAEIAANDPLAVVTGLAASARLRRLAGVDGVIRIGSGFELATRLPVLTFDDMTVPQALARPESEFARLGPAARHRWIARQTRAMNSARGCCLASSWAAGSAVADLGVAAPKVHVTGIGCTFPRLDPERDWSIPRFLFVGFDWERKRGEDVVRAFSELRAEVPEATLDLVGGHPRLDLPGVTGHGRLSLTEEGERERLLALFGRATCFVMPSRLEPYGIAYLEAGMSGVASIGTTVGGAADAIGAGGILVDPTRPEELPAAMRRLARPQEAARLGGLAARHAIEFSWPAVARRVLAAFEPPAA